MPKTISRDIGMAPYFMYSDATGRATGNQIHFLRKSAFEKTSLFVKPEDNIVL